MRKFIFVNFSLLILLLFGFNIKEDTLTVDFVKHSTGYSSSDNSNSNQGLIYKYNNYSPFYFNSLNDSLNGAYNYLGSCGFVAIADILSFYDTYYDDSIIPECYDRTEMISLASGEFFHPSRFNAPGLMDSQNSIPKIEKTIALNNMGYSSPYDYYFDRIINGTNSDGEYYYEINFQYYLIRYSYYRLLWSPFDDSFGTYSFQYGNIISDYLFEDRGFDTNDYHVLSLTDSVKNQIISYINLGLPVIVSLNNGKIGTEYSGHTVIAYDYDSSNDVIYANFGWDSNATHSPLFSFGYTNIEDGVVIIPSNSHTHNCSNNYMDIYGNHYCACSSNLHYAHVDDFYKEYVQCSNNTHKAYCICGRDMDEEHLYLYNHENVSSNFHSVECICGHCINENHSYNDRYNYKSSMIHKAYCICGDIMEELHEFRVQYIGAKQYRVCIHCGYKYLYNGVDPYIIKKEEDDL